MRRHMLVGGAARRLIGPFLGSPEGRPFPPNNNNNPFERSLRQLSGAGALPQLTKDRYPQVKRRDFAELNEKHLGYFKNLLGENRVITDKDECQGFNIDWLKSVRGYSQCILKPKTTQEVSEILKFCNDNRIAVCPQGGNTGLVGGSVPVFDEVVLWTGLMNDIISLDENSGVLVCQSGCILENLENFADERDLMIPLDLGAKGSCHIGGNISTNAGGLRLLRYGNLHGSVLGVEAVKADGEVIDCTSALKKDNTGYHLKHLFIGSEGTLGVVTKVAIQCPPKPRALNVAFLGLESFDDVLACLRQAKRQLGEILSSCELIDNPSLDAVTSHLNLKSPISVYPFYMLIETHGSSCDHDEEKMHGFLESCMSDGLVRDGTTTNEIGKMKAIWELRESITEGLLHDGYVFKYDISLPTREFYSLVPVMRERVKDAVRVCGYGHLGDGNIHLQVTLKEFNEEVLRIIEPFIYEYTAKLRGSVSAEHGVGFRKPKYIHYSKSPGAINLMKQLKVMMDPKGILNPYKVIP
ncbi:unnamed protein product [Phyllotreta striolata]|uniref:D-2-hydroxyglutarate dehydrogenase, mitochondrial n=1 Tax=Phyllotreta striolata TaxID=444603 RepID=A0A9N9TNE4_PHYSR|nr:unnamed protein product [Phyllotreta striolata]